MAETLKFDALTLDYIPVRVLHRLSPEIGHAVRDSVEMEAYRDHILDGMIWKLESCVLAEKIVDKTVEKTARFEHKVQYPATWWQHFKRDVFGRFRATRWIVRRWPVVLYTNYKYEHATLRVNLKQYAKFPAADLARTPGRIHKQLVVPHEELTVSFDH